MITLDALHVVIEFWCKPMLLLGLVYIMMQRPSFRSAASNHAVFVIALLLIFASLGVARFLPEWHWQILPHWFAPASNIAIPVVRFEHSSYLFLGAIALYALGVSWVLCHTLLGVKDALVISRTSRPAMDSNLIAIRDYLAGRFNRGRAPKVLISDVLRSPMVWRWLKPTIVMPASYVGWDRDRIERVMAHEFAHIERNDWLTKISIRIICALLWFVPMVWLISRKIDWYAEVACDDRVLELLDCRGEYADDLLDIAADIKHSAFVLSYLRRSQLYARINLVLNPQREKGRPSKLFKLAVIGVVMSIIIPVAITRVHAHASRHSIFDIANYPLPTLVPLLAVPDKKYWADNSSRLQWLIDQQELLNKRNRKLQDINQPSTEKTDLTKTKAIKAERPAALRAEESMMIVVPENIAAINALNDPLPTESEDVDLPDVAIRGYLPIKMVMPEYPAIALRRKITGRVIVQFDVDEQGQVQNSRIVMAQPRKIFEKTVLKAVKDFQFTPLTVDGKPVITKNVTETFVFNM